MSLPTCLIRRHQQATALSAIGLLPENPGFPAVVNCPLCHRLSLHIFDDESTENVWLYCNECAAAGDIITLGAAIWNMPISATIGKFAEIKAISDDDLRENSDEYLKTLDQRALVRNFWETARDNLWSPHNDEITCRLRTIGVAKEAGEIALVGVAGYDNIKEFVEQLGQQRPVSLLHKPAIVFPYQSIPGVYSGFLLVQYDEADMRQIFIPLSNKRRKPEAGYFLLPAALQPPTPILRDTQFIVADPFWALKNQYMQLRRGLPLLPIMAAYYGNEARSYGKSWRAFHSAKRIFHADAHKPEVISCACNAGGYVAISNALSSERRHRSNPTIDTLAQIKKSANTWSATLAEAVSHMSELAAYSFFTKLSIPPEKTATFLSKCSEQFSQNFADRVIAAATQKRALSPAKQDKFAVVEHDGQWVSAAGRQICNGTVRICKIIYTDRNEKFYVCQAKCRAQVIEFTAAAAKIEHTGLLAYVAKKFAEHGVLFVYDKRWNFTAHVRAVAMHEPEIRYSASELGWSDAAQIFHFGSYDLDTTGSPRDATLLPHIKIQRSFPEPMIALPSTARRFLTPAYDNSFIWLAFSAFTSNVLAPVLGVSPSATATLGTGFDVAAQLWRTLGAESLALTYAHANNANTYIKEKTKTTNWPVCAHSVFDDATISFSALHCHNRPLLAKLTRQTAAAAVGYGWTFMAPPTLTADYDFAVFQHVLPMYVQHVLKNRLRHTTDQPFVLTVMRDLHSWLKTIAGSTFNLACAENNMTTQKMAHVALAHELAIAVDNEALDVLPRPRKKGQAQNYLLQQKSTWWLNRRAIDNYFKKCRSIPPNWVEIVNLLTENDAFIDDMSVHGMLGYVVSRAWCDTNIVISTADKKAAVG